MARKDAQGFELDKNDFVILTKSNARLAQEKVNTSAKETDGKKASKTRKTLSAIREDDFAKNDLYQLIRTKKQNEFNDGFLDIIEKINDTNSTRLSGDEQNFFADYIGQNKDKILGQIKLCDINIVNDLALAGKHASKKRFNFSFASKFCTYISRYTFDEYDEFTPYDGVLQSILPYYAWAYCRDESVENFKKDQNHGYGKYILLVRKIISSAANLYGAEEKLTLKEFDRLLWYKYKGLLGEDLIGLPNSSLVKEA